MAPAPEIGNARPAGRAPRAVRRLDRVDLRGAGVFDFDPATAKRAPHDSVPGLLESFDETVKGALAALAAASEADLDGTWGLNLKGRSIFADRRRRLVMRDFVLSHLVHHRGQLSVYLRLLDVPVPGVYGPSADEKGG